MQDKKLINVSQAVIGSQGVYSIEFHEDQHYTHVKRANPDGTASYFSVGGSGGGTTDYIQTLELVNNGLGLSSTGVGSAFNTTLDVTSLRLGMVRNGNLSGNSPATTFTGGSPDQYGYVNGDWIIDLDTSNIWYLANASTNVWVQSQVGSSADSNLVPFLGAQVDTDTVSIYGIRQSTQRIVLTRTLGTDVDFVLQGGTADLGVGNYGFLTVKVVLDVTGLGGIRLHYKDLNNNNVHVLSASALTSGEIAVTFGYFGTTGLQLIAATQL